MGEIKCVHVESEWRQLVANAIARLHPLPPAPLSDASSDSTFTNLYFEQVPNMRRTNMKRLP